MNKTLQKTLFTLIFCSLTTVSLNAQISTGFDTSEGFTVGAVIGGQNGWTQFDTDPPSFTQPIVSSDNPFAGDAALRIADEPAFADGTNTGGFSPPVPYAANSPSTTSVQVSITDEEGADYFVIGQSPMEMAATYRVQFNFLGNIFVVDDIGAGPVFVDTGVAFNRVGDYVELRVEFDPVAGAIRYFYGGSLIYTGVVWSGTTVEEVILGSDNFQGLSLVQPAFADFDSLSFVEGGFATPLSTFCSDFEDLVPDVFFSNIGDGWQYFHTQPAAPGFFFGDAPQGQQISNLADADGDPGLNSVARSARRW